MREGIVLSIVMAMAGCGGEQPSLHAEPEAQTVAETAPESAGSCDRREAAPAPSDGPRPSAMLADGARQFGAALTDRAETRLADIAAAPASFDGQTVRTEGRIERVCQRMGCWMELSAEGASPVRVPMAGHSFFLPRDVAGHDATIEGRVLVTQLSPEVRAHLASEGAVATADELSIEATSVVVR
jgi:hypothetical protein